MLAQDLEVCLLDGLASLLGATCEESHHWGLNVCSKPKLLMTRREE